MSNSGNLPPLYFDGVMLPYTDSFKYLCDKQINLNTAVDATLRPITTGTFRVKEFVQKHNRLHAYIWLLKTCTIPACMYVYTYMRVSQIWAIPYLQEGKAMGSVLQKWLLAMLKRMLGRHYAFLVCPVLVWIGMESNPYSSIGLHGDTAVKFSHQITI
jgi:hypothetical protein